MGLPYFTNCMKQLILSVFFCLTLWHAESQELYVSTEPASNMASGSIALRLNNRLIHMEHGGAYTFRLNPEIMFGINKKIMVHLNGFVSNMYQQDFRMEGGSVYAKYRFLSFDDIHNHFRMAAFGKLSAISNPGSVKSGNVNYGSDEIDLDGSNSGMMGGVVATQLVHKVAFSSSISITRRLDNPGTDRPPNQSGKSLDYTLSVGYLLLPRTYKDFRQTNVNLYCEFLGSSSLDKKAYYIDIAPAVQFIFNSISRLDISYRTQWTGNMERLSESSVLLRFEYNFLNVFKNRP